MSSRVVIVGYDVDGHVGHHLGEAANNLGIKSWIVSPAPAFDAPRIVAKINWMMRGHLPSKLNEFSARLVQRCLDLEATHLITTGISPVNNAALKQLRQNRVRCINWLTDDPWSASNRAPWFVDVVGGYDVVYTPRETVNADLRAAGVAEIRTLPFAYCEKCHYPVPAEPRDVVTFVGGADRDRLQYIVALLDAAVPVEVYGGYWHKFKETRSIARGFVDSAGYRSVVSACAANIGLVRARNRDTNAMRTYELPAMRGVTLAQDTPDHRALYGNEGAFYFSSPESLVEAAQQALADRQNRDRVAQTGYTRLIEGQNSYRDRLRTLLTD